MFKKNKIDLGARHRPHRSPTGSRSQVAGDRDTQTLRDAQRILIATGSAPIELPASRRSTAQRIISSTEALALPAVPKRLVVVGAGAIGLELGSVWSRLGAEVLVVELLDRIVPGMDRRWRSCCSARSRSRACASRCAPR